jgi:putative transcriptional regulator
VPEEIKISFEMILRNNLKAMRFNKNQVTQEELAEQVNVSRQTIHAIENGKFNPSVKLALLIANFFGCHIEDIFYIIKEDE